MSLQQCYKILETAKFALEKHKEELEVKHTNASARLQRRLTKRMSNQEPVGTKEGGEVKVMEPLATLQLNN